MKKLFTLHYSLFAAIALCAMDPSLLMRTHTDPSRMRGWSRSGKWTPLCTGYMLGGETAFTAVCWLRYHVASPSYIIMSCSFWSIEAARATREGGAELPDLIPMTSASGAQGWSFADPHYDTQGVRGWDYGCYAVNVETPTPLTVTLAGSERQVDASNGVVQVFNVQGSAADYSLAVAPSDPSATYRIGIAVNPFIRFFGIVNLPAKAAWEVPDKGGAPVVPSITNEWMMCVAQARIEGGKAVERNVQFTWDAEFWPVGEQTNDASRATFAKDARVALMTMHVGGTELPRDAYGFKIFPTWLTDDQLRNVRDLDMFEMQRRGMQRYVQVSP